MIDNTLSTCYNYIKRQILYKTKTNNKLYIGDRIVYPRAPIPTTKFEQPVLSLLQTYGYTPVMLVIIFAKYRNNQSRNVCAVEWTRQDVTYFSSVIATSSLNYLKVKGHYARPFHANDYLCLIHVMQTIYPELNMLQSGHDMQDGWTDRDEWVSD